MLEIVFGGGESIVAYFYRPLQPLFREKISSIA